MTDTSRWRRLAELFAQSCDMPAGDRGAYLDVECREDPELRAELEQLLAVDHESRPAIARVIQSAATALVDDETLGHRLGAYRVTRVLGRGGMGIVFHGERDDGAFEQEVAIKVVRGDLASGPAQRERFRSERQILARLDHPNIARLIDGGETEDGMPFLVMDYVRGDPIDIWCARRQLTIGQRLELFLEVCQAVLFAHQNLVMHRDIKPSNILVTEAGVPKLLDFGVAKLIEPERGSAASRSETIGNWITVDFASPEQVRAEAVTTRTDIYALGLLLYVLLTTQRPYRFRGTSALEIEEVICEREVTQPSLAVSQSDGGRQADGARSLRGDLDNIVMKALRKEPDQRYASVGELMADLRAYRDGHPVSARAATPGYKLKKFAGRHRKAVWAAAAALVALMLGVGLFVSGVTRERDRAQLEAEKARQVAKFLSELFEGSDPAQTLGEEVTARQLLERGAVRLRAELGDQPEVRAQMMTTVGEVSRKVGNYELAVDLLEDALDLRSRLFGDRDLATAHTMHELAATLHEAGDHDRGEALFRTSLAIRREHLPEHHRDVLASLSGLGLLVADQGDFPAAESLYREALAALEAAPLADRRAAGAGEAATLHNNLGRVLHDRGELAEAERWLRASLEGRRAEHGSLHPAVATATSNLAVLLRDRAQHDEAEALYLEALALSRKLYGDTHPSTAVPLNNLASLYKSLGRTSEATRLQREALGIFRASFGEVHPRVAMSLNNLANLLHDQGEVEEARALHEQTLELNAQLYGERHPVVAGTFTNLASLLFESGDLVAAEPLQRRALALDLKLLGNRHAYVAGDLDLLAQILMAKGDFEAAQPLLEESLAIKREALSESHPGFATTLALEGRLLSETGRESEAEAPLRRAIAIQAAALPEDHPDIARTRSFLAQCLLKQGRVEPARALLEAALPRLRSGGFRYAQDTEAAERSSRALRAAESGSR